MSVDCAIGFRVYRATAENMHAFITSSRAWCMRADGGAMRELAPELARDPHCWTDFTGWSTDGRYAVIGAGWESSENAEWETAHAAFRMTEGWRYDQYLLDMTTGNLCNVTAVDRVSPYNAGLFFWPGNPACLGFQALIDGQMTPYRMRMDGSGKTDLSTGDRAFSYGFTASPDGRRIAYHKAYQLMLANADGSDVRWIDTGHPFNFCPVWSPDGKWVLFVSGEHYDCHPHVIAVDGTGLRKLADRRGYRGVVELLDVPAFHSESSDIPAWSPDGAWVYYTAAFGDAIELMRVNPDGMEERLTDSPPGTCHYHPKPSPDGVYLLYNVRRDGARQLYVAHADGTDARAVTALPPEYGAVHASWRPDGR